MAESGDRKPGEEYLMGVEPYGIGEGPWNDGTSEGELFYKYIHKPRWQPRWLFFLLNRLPKETHG